MRYLCMTAVVVLSTACLGRAQPTEEGLRHGIRLNLDSYPQDAPKAALESVIKAVEKKNFDYLLAQLADPEFVDTRVKEVHGGHFEELSRETARKYADNPDLVKDLKRFLQGGDWDSGDKEAVCKLKDVADRQIVMLKLGNRWYLQNSQKPSGTSKEK